MINHRLGVYLYFIAGVLDAPAEVDFLHMGEEVGIQSAHRAVHITAHEQGGSAGPEDVHLVVVLAVVLFHIAENAPAAERVSVFVHETAGGARVLEAAAVVVGEQFGLHRRDALVTVHLLNDRLNPVRRHLDVGIEQAIVLCLNVLEGVVVAPRKPLVLCMFQHTHGRMRLLQERYRTVGRGVVGDHNLRIFGQILLQDRQELLQKTLPVPVQNHYC